MSINLLDSFMKKFKKNSNAGDHSPQKEQEIPKKKDTPAYIELVAEIDRMISEEEICRLFKQESLNMVSYSNGKRKIININKNSDPPRTYFLFSGANHRAKELAVKGLRPVSKNEAKQKRYGPVKALYTGYDAKVVRSMLQGVN